MKKIFSIILLIFSVLYFYAEEISFVNPHYVFLPKNSTKPTVRLLFAGDAMQHSVQYQWAHNAQNNTYNYEPNFRYLRPYLDSADINLVNFETTLAGPPYSGYPKFRTPDSYFTALCDAGFQVFALANNHILDGGQAGLHRTLDQMGQIAHCGAYRDTAHRSREYPLLLEIEGVKIALFNATYGTNQIVPTPPNYVNYIETEELLLDMEKSKRDSTIDLRVMFIHWGDEYQLRHNPLQSGVAQWLADLGFDLIIGSHPHVVQDQEILQSEDGRRVPVVYSLGNFISNQRRLNCNGGIIVTTDIDKKSKKIKEINYVPVYVHKGFWGKEKNYFCLPTIDYLNKTLPQNIKSDSLQQDLLLFHNNTLHRMGEKMIIY